MAKNNNQIREENFLKLLSILDEYIPLTAMAKMMDITVPQIKYVIQKSERASVAYEEYKKAWENKRANVALSTDISMEMDIRLQAFQSSVEGQNRSEAARALIEAGLMAKGY